MKAVVITVSDKASIGKRIDTAGPAVKKILKSHNYEVGDIVVIPDEKSLIINQLNYFIDQEINLIITVGGTGFSKRDITPEATKAVIERQTPGIDEMMRQKSSEITNRAILSRATSGIKDSSLVINLPGSEKSATENLNFVISPLKHGLEILLGLDSECGISKKK